MATYELCPHCDSGYTTAPMEPGVFKCPHCKGTGVKLVSREVKNGYEGSAECMERWFLRFGLGVIIMWTLFIFALIGALVALIIYLV